MSWCHTPESHRYEFDDIINCCNQTLHTVSADAAIKTMSLIMDILKIQVFNDFTADGSNEDLSDDIPCLFPIATAYKELGLRSAGCQRIFYTGDIIPYSRWNLSKAVAIGKLTENADSKPSEGIYFPEIGFAFIDNEQHSSATADFRGGEILADVYPLKSVFHALHTDGAYWYIHDKPKFAVNEIRLALIYSLAEKIWRMKEFAQTASQRKES